MRMTWREPERFVLFLFAGIVALDAALLAVRPLQLAWFDYALVAVGAFGLAGIGQFYRASGRSERLADGLIATALLMLMPAALIVFNYLLMPTARSPIDGVLQSIDALYGYHWPDWIGWAAANPLANEVIRFAYTSTMLQMALLVVVLSLSGQRRHLDLLLLTIAITSVVTVGFWGLFPSHGAKSLTEVEAVVEAVANPIVTSAYGAELVRMAREGAAFLSPSDVKGLIAFPSYHAVLACITIAAAWPIRLLRWPLLLVNLLVLPGCLLHGGHHLIDVPAGVVVFFLGRAVAKRALDRVSQEAASADRSALA